MVALVTEAEQLYQAPVLETWDLFRDLFVQQVDLSKPLELWVCSLP